MQAYLSIIHPKHHASPSSSMIKFQPSTIILFLQMKVRHLTTPLLYTALLNFYTFHQKDTPALAKRIIMGALVYLFSRLMALLICPRSQATPMFWVF